jgi:hypothetical protein
MQAGVDGGDAGLAGAQSLIELEPGLFREARFGDVDGDAIAGEGCAIRRELAAPADIDPA